MRGGSLSSARALLDDMTGVIGSQLWLAVALMAGGALAEGIGLLVLLPLLKLAGGTAVHKYADWFDGRVDPFLAILTLFIVIMTARALIILARDRALAQLETDYDVSLRLRAAATLAQRGWPFASGIGPAGMQTLLANDVPRSGFAVHQGLAAATALFLLTAQFAVAVVLSPIMALGVLSLLALGIPWQLALVRRGRISGMNIVDGQNDATQAAYTFHAGLKAAMAQGSVGGFLTAYGAALDRLAERLIGLATDMARSRARQAIAAAFAAALVVGAGHWLALDLPRLLTLLILFARMSAPAQALQQAWIGLAAYAPSYTAIEKRLGPLVAEAPPMAQAKLPLNWKHFALDRVGLSRDDGFVLAPVNLLMEPGDWVALLGPSGTGKTTLVDIVAGLVAPTEGHVAVDGLRLDAGRLPRWQAGISYVGQQEVPVELTVSDTLGAADNDERWPILELVGLAGTIRATGAGLDLPLDDRGARLSGGERQRLLIARALLRKPRLMLLDEATAAIDIAGEQMLIERIRAAYPAMAVLLVAHRTESAARCDRSLTLPRSQ